MSDNRRKDPYGRLMKKEHIPKDDEFFRIEEYSWLNFKQEDLVTTDNIRASVVSHDLHDPQVLWRKVTVPKQFTSVLRNPARPLYPVDLSDDYRKFMQETLQRKKSRNFDDDDTATIDFSEIATPPDLEDRMSKWKSKQKGAGQAVAESASMSSSSEEAAQMTPEQNVEPVPPTQVADQTSGPEVEEAPRSFVRMRPASDVSQSARDKVLARLDEMTGGGALDPLESGVLDEDDGFEHGEGSGEEQASDEPEGDQRVRYDVSRSAQARESNRAAQELSPGFDSSESKETGSESHLQVLPSEMSSNPEATNTLDDASALADAFERGRLEGEESGRVEGHRLALEQFKEIHTALEQTVLHLNETKKQIIDQGREIFLEMLKLTAEGLLRSQLRFSDQDLLKLFQSAVDSVGAKQPIIISAHPTTVSRLKGQLTGADLPFSGVEWREDAQVPVGDFTFDSQDEVLRVSLRKRLEQHIENLSQGLFEGSVARSDKKENEFKEESGEHENTSHEAAIDKGAG